MFNKTTIIGKLNQEPEFKTVGANNDFHIANLSLYNARNVARKGEQDNWKYENFDVTMKGEDAIAFGQMGIRKGALMYVECYQDTTEKDGKKYKNLVVSKWEVLMEKPKVQRNQQQAQPAQQNFQPQPQQGYGQPFQPQGPFQPQTQQFPQQPQQAPAPAFQPQVPPAQQPAFQPQYQQAPAPQQMPQAAPPQFQPQAPQQFQPQPPAQAQGFYQPAPGQAPPPPPVQGGTGSPF